MARTAFVTVFLYLLKASVLTFVRTRVASYWLMTVINSQSGSRARLLQNVLGESMTFRERI